MSVWVVVWLELSHFLAEGINCRQGSDRATSISRWNRPMDWREQAGSHKQPEGKKAIVRDKEAHLNLDGLNHEQCIVLK